MKTPTIPASLCGSWWRHRAMFPSRQLTSLGIAITFAALLYSSIVLLRLLDLGIRLPSGHPNTKPADIDWSRFAYAQYATSAPYICNSVMLFETLHRLGSKADRIMLFPVEHDPNANNTTAEAKLLLQARDDYGVILKPIELLIRGTGDYANSFTKLLIFNQTQYDRILMLDSDSTILQTMDELFLMPPAPVAMPMAYWLSQDVRMMMTSALVLLQPSEAEFNRIMDEIGAAPAGYDMDIVNKIYGDSALGVPHRPYMLLTGEFRNDDHVRYLGIDNLEEQWDPDAVLAEAKFIHFSDWPAEKPYVPYSDYKTSQPDCVKTKKGGQDCRNQALWLRIYADFIRRKQEICSI